MSRNQLILLYLVGFTASIYIGMRIEAWRWGKRTAVDIQKAYNRGVASGLNRERHIQQQRDELTSSIRILTDEDRPNQRSNDV